MKVNTRRGIARLSAVFVTIWLGLWTYTYVDAGTKSAGELELAKSINAIKMERFGNIPGGADYHPYYQLLTAEADEAHERRVNEIDRRDNALRYGLSGVAAYLVTLVVFGWIWRGFRPYTMQAQTEVTSQMAIDHPLPRTLPKFELRKNFTKFFFRTLVHDVGGLLVVLLISIGSGTTQAPSWQAYVAPSIYASIIGFIDVEDEDRPTSRIRLLRGVILVVLAFVIATLGYFWIPDFINNY